MILIIDGFSYKGPRGIAGFSISGESLVRCLGSLVKEHCYMEELVHYNISLGKRSSVALCSV
tara:strand:+ start:366 stop:551 length:186 start_codon:yes stop_codon:yes gene_type:complete